MVGAGTAITVGLAKKALEAGAQFLLTPGTPLDVMEYCKKNRVKLLPSVLTPSEVAVSLEYGYQTMKLFPPGNCKKFLASGYLGVGMASNLMPKEAVAKGDWKACATSVRRIVGELNNGQKF